MQELTHSNFVIGNDDYGFIPLDIRYPVPIKKMPLILIFHGFKAWKDWGFFPYLSDQISSQCNSIVINSSFSKCGVPNGEDKYIEVEKFANNTVSQELKDAEYLINSFKQKENETFSQLSNIWNNEIILIGHSRGAAVSILTAETRTDLKEIILLSSISRLGRAAKHQTEEHRKAGFMEFKDMRTGIALRMNKIYLDDLEQNADKFNLTESISKINIPMLLIHGKQDVTVPPKESEELFARTKPGLAELKIIEKGSHTFNINHPFKCTNPSLEEVLEKIVNFINRNEKK